MKRWLAAALVVGLSVFLLNTFHSPNPETLPAHTQLEGEANLSFWTYSVPYSYWAPYPCVNDTEWNYPLTPIDITNNICDVRVWLHQRTDWWNGGWAICVNPLASEAYVPYQFEYAQNIYISDNPNLCINVQDDPPQPPGVIF